MNISPSTNQRATEREINLSIGAAPSAYLIFSLIFASMAVLGLLADRRSAGFPGASLITIAIFVAFLVWLKAFRLQVRDGVFSYRSLFTGTQSMRMSDICGVETKLSISDSLGPFVQLVIKASPQHGEKPIIVNLKVFSRKDINTLHDLLTQNNIEWNNRSRKTKSTVSSFTGNGSENS